jgi:hypothetical protein
MIKVTPVMKNLFLSTLCAVTALGLSSCCCLFSKNTYKTKETQLAGHKMVTREVTVSTGAKGMMETQTVSEKVPVYKEKTKTHHVKCVRRYCPKSGPCGTTSEAIVKMSTSQGGVGSPHIGLIPTMKPLAP